MWLRNSPHSRRLDRRGRDFVAEPSVIPIRRAATATVQYFGLVAGLVGLYQFNVIVPNVPAGDVPLTVGIGGVAANSGLFLTISQ